ncbi:hypothetical protein PR048_005213 [Dryococelus australis]|uniref:Transposase n=1 Tax=Dryococelus australis TaxID=614101 RepID=A0ABQ9I7K3_9NEOP|nr:hypothetical protein PR048_005213 [Dryococelus australis]
MFEVKKEVEESYSKIVAILSVMQGAYLSLWKNLQISTNKVSFTNSVDVTREVRVFADIPHLIKLLRNTFLDYGIWLPYGTEVSKQILHDKQLSLTPKLDGSVHLNVSGSARQKLKYATQLFSHHTATSLKRKFPQKPQVSKHWAVIPLIVATDVDSKPNQVWPQWLSGYSTLKRGHSGPVARAHSSGATQAQWLKRSQVGPQQLNEYKYRKRATVTQLHNPTGMPPSLPVLRAQKPPATRQSQAPPMRHEAETLTTADISSSTPTPTSAGCSPSPQTPTTGIAASEWTELPQLGETHIDNNTQDDSVRCSVVFFCDCGRPECGFRQGRGECVLLIPAGRWRWFRGKGNVVQCHLQDLAEIRKGMLPTRLEAEVWRED